MPPRNETDETLKAILFKLGQIHELLFEQLEGQKSTAKIIEAMAKMPNPSKIIEEASRR
jgi:hypothetical protein